MELRINAVDRERWDQYVSRSPNAHFMQSHAWGQLQQQAGWRSDYLTLEDGGSIRGAALLLSRAIPVTGQRVFYMPRGPAVEWQDREERSRFADELRSFITQRRGVFLRADPYVEDGAEADQALTATGFRKLSRTWSYWNAPKYVFWLDLAREQDAVFNAMTGSCRRDVRGGYRKGVEFSRGGIEDMGDFHRLLVAMSQTKGIAAHDEEYYIRLHRTLNTSCSVELFLARYDNKVIAVGMSVMYGKTAWLLYAASDSEYFKLGINRNIQWEMIRWAHGSGCTRYDFRGTATGDPPSPKDPGYGVYKFKKSFGPEFIRLAGYYDLVGRPISYRVLRLAEEQVLPSAYRAKVWFDRHRVSR